MRTSGIAATRRGKAELFFPIPRDTNGDVLLPRLERALCKMERSWRKARWKCILRYLGVGSRCLLKKKAHLEALEVVDELAKSMRMEILTNSVNEKLPIAIF